MVSITLQGPQAVTPKHMLALYIDHFKVSNPLGTSIELHKITALYWVEIINNNEKFL